MILLYAQKGQHIVSTLTASVCDIIIDTEVQIYKSFVHKIENVFLSIDFNINCFGCSKKNPSR